VSAAAPRLRGHLHDPADDRAPSDPHRPVVGDRGDDDARAGVDQRGLNLVRAYRLREKPPPRQQPGAPVFVPFTPSSRQSLLGIRRAALDQRNARPDIEHVALALIAMTDGPVPPILSSLGCRP
jgi:hypothetical protein